MKSEAVPATVSRHAIMRDCANFKPLSALGEWEGSTKGEPGDLPVFKLLNFRDKGFD